MPARKRRKSTGVTGFVADVLREQQKARQQTQQLEWKASQAWAKEEAKTTGAAAREKIRTDRQATREREIAAGHEEAEAVTRLLQARVTELVIAQMALRTIRSIFAADQSGLARMAACNGYVDTINTATGQPAHWCLISLRVPRADFDQIDLAGVKPLDCLSYLHAKISRTPEKCLPVQPIIDYPWDDLPYSDELDSAAAQATDQEPSRHFMSLQTLAINA
jgi:hypothetical protein